MKSPVSASARRTLPQSMMLSLRPGRLGSIQRTFAVRVAQCCSCTRALRSWARSCFLVKRFSVCFWTKGANWGMFLTIFHCKDIWCQNHGSKKRWLNVWSRFQSIKEGKYTKHTLKFYELQRNEDPDDKKKVDEIWGAAWNVNVGNSRWWWFLRW